MTLTVEELFAPFITGADEGRVGPEAVATVREKLLTLRDTDREAFYRLWGYEDWGYEDWAHEEE